MSKYNSNITIISLLLALMSGVYSTPSLSQNPAPAFQPYNNNIQNRQWKMDRRHDAMTQLNLMLRGQIGFDRDKAIHLAENLQHASGNALTNDFRPESIYNYDTRLKPNFLANPATFRAFAKALKQTTQTLITELKKQVTIKQGAVMLPKHINPFDTFGKKTVAVSPSVFGAYRAVATVCDNCHRSFRN